MTGSEQMLPFRGSWQREALTEGAGLRDAPSTMPSGRLSPAGYLSQGMVPLPRWGRIVQ